MQPITGTDTSATARGVDRLMLNFTSNDEPWGELPTIVSGEGCYVTDSRGRRYLDGLGGLYTTQVGHGRAELAEVAARQMRTLEYYPAWSLHHPAALELAAKLSELAPGGGAWSSFFVQSGSEGIEAMLKVVRQYHAAQGEPMRFKFLSRRVAYHGVTMGALALSGLPTLQAPFEPLPRGFLHVANTLEDPEGAAEAIADAIEMGPPSSIGAVVLEPVQNAGGCLVPPAGYWRRVREICDAHGVLLVADATICGFGRLGTWFGTERFDAVPDIITFAKGLTSGYVPMGGVLVAEHVRAALDTQPMFLHGSTFGGHPVAAAVARENIAIIEREHLLENVLANEAAFGNALRAVADRHRIAIDVRGLGYFWAIELDPTWADGSALDADSYQRLVKLGLHHRLLELGLLCRVDDRDSPALQFSPALIADVGFIDRLAELVDTAIGDLEAKLGHRDA